MHAAPGLCGPMLLRSCFTAILLFKSPSTIFLKEGLRVSLSLSLSHTLTHTHTHTHTHSRKSLPLVLLSLLLLLFVAYLPVLLLYFKCTMCACYFFSLVSFSYHPSSPTIFFSFLPYYSHINCEAYALPLSLLRSSVLVLQQIISFTFVVSNQTPRHDPSDHASNTLARMACPKAGYAYEG